MQRCLRISILSLSLVLTGIRGQTSEPVRLMQGELQTRQSGPGKTEAFIVDVDAGQFAHVVVRKKAVDIEIRLSGPDGKTVLEAHSPNGIIGPEPIAWIAEKSGTYRLIATKSADSTESGSYEIELVALRAPGELDPQWIEAERLMAQAEAEEHRGTREGQSKSAALYLESGRIWERLKEGIETALCLDQAAGIRLSLGNSRDALNLYNQALPIERALGDRSLEATTLAGIGNVYIAMGENQKALDFYNQALAITRAIGDRSGEAGTLIGFGYIYNALGDKQKALDFLNQALPLARVAGNRSGEATALMTIGMVHSALHERKEALEFLGQALPMYRAVGDRPDEATTLAGIGNTYREMDDNRTALDFFTQALSIDRELGDSSAESLMLNLIGSLYRDLSDNRKALDVLNQALTIHRAAGDRSGEATALNDIGTVYIALGERQKALDYFNETLPIYRAIGNRSGEASTLSNLGFIYSDMGDKQKALDFFNQALSICRAAGDRVGEPATLTNIGSVYSDLGDKQKALEFYNQALSIARAVGNRSIEATTLSDIGLVYSNFGENQKAMDFYNQALPIDRAGGRRSGEATILSNLGNLYQGLGEYQKALDLYNQALLIDRAIGARSKEAGTLHNIGSIYRDLGENQKALDFYNQALPIKRALGNRSKEATTLHNIGVLYNDLGENQKALDFFDQALLMQRTIGDRSGEAATLNSIGNVYHTLGEYQRALDFYNQALPIHRAVGYRSGEARTLRNMQNSMRKISPSLAVVFGKQAVNVFQSIRRDNQGIEEGLRASYDKSIEHNYRGLADLLVSLSRFAEAEEVLDLLKEKESFDYIRRDSIADKLRSTTLLDTERNALQHYDEIVDRIVVLGNRKAEFLAKRNTAELTAAELAESGRIDADLIAANTVLNRFIAEEERAFAPGSALARQTADLRQATGIQKSLQKLGPSSVAIYTLAAEDHYVALLVTPGARKAYTSRISREDLNRKLFSFRQALQNPVSNPLPIAQELYRLLLPEGLDRDLGQLAANAGGPLNVMWSLDGALRYVPIGALHDGKQFLVERFRNSLITPESLNSLEDENSGEWKGEGFGVSAAHPGFTALPGVPDELGHIFRTAGELVTGTVLLDAEFRKETFEHDLTGKINPIVHIATHFDAEPGVAANSSMLLGDGTKLSLAELEASENLFANVDLVTLSACSTGFQIGQADGREVDNLGVISQRLGAKSVIASLWNVSDNATAALMERFYRNWREHPELGKGEALRRAQADMAESKVKPEASAALNRGVTAAGAPAIGSTSWVHPYYWGPFILIGNWK
jgi:tetratricopeptide (TPR) repeat protein